MSTHSFRSRSTSVSDDSEQQDEEVVIVDHAPGLVDQSEPSKDTVPEKKGGWMSSWFGSKQTKTADEQTAGRSEPDGAEGGAAEGSPQQKRKCEHVVVPNKGELQFIHLFVCLFFNKLRWTCYG